MTTTEPQKPKGSKNPFERLLTAACTRYEVRNLAVVRKIPTEWVPIRDASGQIIGAKVERKAPVDYLGAINEPLIPVAFEAKLTGKSALPLSQFEEHQILFLHKWPGLKFAAIAYWGAQKFFILSWPQLEYWLGPESPRKSIPLEWAEENCIEIFDKGGWVDWLEGARKLLS